MCQEHYKGFVYKNTTLPDFIITLIVKVGKLRHSITSLGHGDTAKERQIQDWGIYAAVLWCSLLH